MHKSTTSNQIEFFSNTEMGVDIEKAGSNMLQLVYMSAAVLIGFALIGAVA